MAFGDFGELSNEVLSVTRPEPRPTLAPKPIARSPSNFSFVAPPGTLGGLLRHVAYHRLRQRFSRHVTET